MEFKAVYGSNHIIEPIGYGIVRKKIKRGAPVRSAAEQFAIQSTAYIFSHPFLRVLRPLNLESPTSYTMEQLYEGQIIPQEFYRENPELYAGLMIFQQFMAERGYWPWGYKVVHTGSACVILDFSQFGTIDRDRVKFPKEKTLRTLDSIEERFPLYFPPPPAAPELEPMVIENLALELEKIDELTLLGISDGSIYHS